MSGVVLYVITSHFLRPQTTLTKAALAKLTAPAMAAGLSERPWMLTDAMALVEVCGPTAESAARRPKD